MGPIVLDVSRKDVYAAWNSAFRDTVEGFKYDAKSFYRSPMEAEAGLPKQCLNETWISQLPSSLFFSQQRVFFDPKKLKIVKDYSPFTFDKVIYPDRYLY